MNICNDIYYALLFVQLSPSWNHACSAVEQHTDNGEKLCHILHICSWALFLFRLLFGIENFSKALFGVIS